MAFEQLLDDPDLTARITILDVTESTDGANRRTSNGTLEFAGSDERERYEVWVDGEKVETSEFISVGPEEWKRTDGGQWTASDPTDDQPFLMKLHRIEGFQSLGKEVMGSRDLHHLRLAEGLTPDLWDWGPNDARFSNVEVDLDFWVDDDGIPVIMEMRATFTYTEGGQALEFERQSLKMFEAVGGKLEIERPDGVTVVVTPVPSTPDVAILQMTVTDTKVEVHPVVLPPGPARIAVNDAATASGSSLCISGPFVVAPAGGHLNKTERNPSCIDRPASRWDLVQLDRGFYAFYVKTGSLTGPIAQIQVRDSPGTELIKETFEHGFGPWLSEAQSDHTSGYADGGYQVTVSAPDRAVWWFLDEPFDDSQTVVETATLDIDGTFGLLCRYERTDFYAFTITATGAYAIDKHLGDEWVTLAEGRSSAVNKGISAINHLRGDCVGQQLTFYANGQLLRTITDASLRDGGNGLVVSSFATGGAGVRFDNFTVVQP